MPAPLESRVTNLEALVAGIITDHGDQKDRAAARHDAVMEEFGNVHAALAEHGRRFDRVDVRFDELNVKLDAILELLRDR